MKIPRNYSCKKVTGKKMIICSPSKTKRGRKTGRKTGRVPKRKRGPAMRMAKKRAAKMPGGKGPVAKRPAGRKILGK